MAKKKTATKGAGSGRKKNRKQPSGGMRGRFIQIPPTAVVKTFPIAGLGASAGGLEALEKFFAHVPADCGIAFVVVTHQHPGHTSLLPELLGKCTRMRVRVAENGMVVEPNSVYMSPPEGYLAILDGALHVMEPDETGPLRLPIDYFFRSLAEDQKEKAIGIVLSGTGTDGTLGLKAIKGAAGMTMAQEPVSAKYSGMPDSAIATGLVDYILPVDAIPQRLVAYAHGPYLAEEEPGAPGESKLSEPMQKIILLLRARTGHDFTAYKPNTIRRRIERRINVHQIKDPQHYLRLLHDNPHELDLLFKELLIGVTNFFRDPEAFNALAKTAVPRLLAARTDEAPVRVWVPGCSTGEEAYTIAMVLQECMGQLKRPFPVQIFGTDLDTEAVEAARTGSYPEGIARDVRPQRLARFFTKTDGGYRIKKDIREMVIFAPQNVLKDPPFTKLDMVLCRNLLIYLKPEAQARLLSLFHYALKPGGILFLGTSESVTTLGDYFNVVNKKWKIFARKEAVSARPLPAEFTQPPVAPLSTLATGTELPPTGRRLQLPAMIEKALLKSYAPATVVVNERGDILYIHGRTGDYLEPSTGQPRLNVFEMAREGLRIELAAALRQAGGRERPVIHNGVRVKANAHFVSVRLIVAKLTEPEAIRGLFMVTFQTEAPVKTVPAKRAKASPAKSSGRVMDLERELQYTRETLQSTVEELETSNEELKSTNEELQSTNEELQSANEELETSKEEMQSLNEELQTVNAQLTAKLDDLAQVNDDMLNLLNSTAIATIFLDQDLRIKRFTSEATKLVNLIPTDVGRPISDLASNLRYDGLQADAAAVLEKLVSREKEVQTRDGHWRQVRIHPYRTTDNVIEGVVLTFVDINRLKEAEQIVAQARAYAESIVATVHEPLVVLDADLRVVSANPAFYRAFKLAPKDTERQRIYDVGHRQWDIPRLRHLLEEVLPQNSTFDDFEVVHEFAGLGRRAMLLNARRLERESGAAGMILLAIEDVTDRVPANNPAAPPAKKKR